MRSTTLAAAITCTLAFTATASAEPKQIWDIGGFKNPESAVVENGVIYVSNVDGGADTKDGKGSISQVSLDGKMIKADWVSGLDSPKGLALYGGRLFAADIDQLVEIELATGKITNRYPAKGAKFLNDVAAGPDGHIYVSDMLTDTIWRLADGKFEAWVQSDALEFPNGVTVQDGKVLVAAWGKIDGEGFATSVPGHVIEISIADKSIKAVGSNAPIGNLDGIERTGGSSYLLTDWINGGLFTFDAATGKAVKVLPLSSGSADLGFVPATRMVIVPMMKDNRVLAFTLD